MLEDEVQKHVDNDAYIVHTMYLYYESRQKNTKEMPCIFVLRCM